MHVLQLLKSCHAAPPGGRLIFSKNTDLTHLVSAKYLKKHLSNQFEILQVYWYISEGGQVRFETRSEIQYGRQAAILDFRFRSISREAFEQSIWNFAGLSVCIRRRSSSIFDPIRNPIWPLGGHLEFSFPLNISRSDWAIDLKFCRFIGTY